MSKFSPFGKHVEEPAEADKNLLGGKGAGLIRMTALGIPVPPGFTIPTTFCKEFEAELNPAAANAFVKGLLPDVMDEMAVLEKVLGYAPLVSVRSGAPVSMPGMMDTILNVGMTTKTLPFWEQKLGTRAARDSYRRLIQMLGSTAYGVPHEKFEHELATAKSKAKVKEDKDLDAEALTNLVASYKAVFAMHAGPFPDDVEAQLLAAIGAVFRSWNNERAKIYRKINNIDPTMGTAVTVQAMVFGNMNDDSGSGVLFSRNPSTGANELYGEFLPNAQGEDVVAGIRTPLALIDMQPLWPHILDELNEVACTLEAEYLDMVDLEFTVQDKKLYLLQCRPGKRGAMAAFRIARDLVKESVIDQKTAIGRLTRKEYKLTRQPVVDPAFKVQPAATGLFGSTGVAVGKPVYTAKAAIDCKEPCILVTHETDPDDVGGMNASRGILTATGGQTSHAAVVARGMNKPCVVGCLGIVDKVKAATPSKITIDGATGRVWFEVDVPVIDNSADEAVAEIVSWIVQSTEGPQIHETLAGFTGDKPFRITGKAAADHFSTLLALPKKDCLTIDLTAQAQIDCADDSALISLYTEAVAASYDVKSFLQTMAKEGQKLAGITLVGAPRAYGFEKFGIKVDKPTVESLDELLDGGEVLLSPKVANEVSNSAFAKIKTLLATAGKPLKVAKKDKYTTEALPAEYQVFKALS